MMVISADMRKVQKMSNSHENNMFLIDTLNYIEC